MEAIARENAGKAEPMGGAEASVDAAGTGDAAQSPPTPLQDKEEDEPIDNVFRKVSQILGVKVERVIEEGEIRDQDQQQRRGPSAPPPPSPPPPPPSPPAVKVIDGETLWRRLCRHQQQNPIDMRLIKAPRIEHVCFPLPRPDPNERYLVTPVASPPPPPPTDD